MCLRIICVLEFVRTTPSILIYCKQRKKKEEYEMNFLVQPRKDKGN